MINEKEGHCKQKKHPHSQFLALGIHTPLPSHIFIMSEHCVKTHFKTLLFCRRHNFKFFSIWEWVNFLGYKYWAGLSVVSLRISCEVQFDLSLPTELFFEFTKGLVEPIFKSPCTTSASILSPASGLLKRAYQPYYTDYAILELQEQVGGQHSSSFIFIRTSIFWGEKSGR